LGLTRPNAVIDGLGRRTNLLRDAWGRLLMKDYAIDPDAQYSYDALSRLVRMVDGSGTTSWTYDANGWLRQEASGIHQAQYDYHPNGLRARLTSIHNLGVLTLEYSYDGANRPAVLNQNRHYSG
jgi:YD repeat-containing protein